MKYLTKNKHWNIVEDYNLDKLLYLLIDRPTESDDITIEWKNKLEQSHRDYDLPAFIVNEKNSVRLYWDINNIFHKELRTNGVKGCYYNDKFIKEQL